MSKRLGLPAQMGIGMVLGIVIGAMAPSFSIDASWFKPLGDLFITLVRMVVVPLVFTTLVAGAASVCDVKELGRVASKTILYYLLTTTAAVVIGLVLANLQGHIMNLAKFPRRGYVKEATPIEYLPNFSKALGNKVNVYIKRNDLLPGCAGGNKTRKLDFSIADALACGADTLITCGAVQSNHCRLTLAWAVHEGLDCHLVLEERVKGSYNPEASGNNFLYQLLGVKSITVVPGGSPMMEEMEKVAERLRAKGKKPYIIPGGASNHIGALGYVSCAQEIMQQMFDMGLNFDHVVVPSGSAGTHAGMIAGFCGNNMDIPMSGIDVSRPGDVQRGIVHKLAQETLDYIGAGITLPEEKVVCFGDYYQPGYSIPNDGMVEAVKMLARTEAILLDPVYSGKAMSGMIDLIRKDYFPRGANVLFLHTGGSPALYAYLPTFR